MDVSAVNGSALTPEVQAQYSVKLIKMAREADAVVNELILDTAEISEEAMNKYAAEVKANN